MFHLRDSSLAAEPHRQVTIWARQCLFRTFAGGGTGCFNPSPPSASLEFLKKCSQGCRLGQAGQDRLWQPSPTPLVFLTAVRVQSVSVLEAVAPAAGAELSAVRLEYKRAVRPPCGSGRQLGRVSARTPGES